MIAAAFRWWIQHLLVLVPGQAAAGTPPRDALLIESVGAPAAGLTLTLRRRHTERVLGQFTSDAAGMQAMRQAVRDNRHGPVVLRMPPDTLLEREVVLPLAAEREAASALRFELDRITPFQPEEVYWTGNITCRDRRRGRLHLQLLLVPRAVAAPLLAAAAVADAMPTLLEGQAADGKWRRIALTRTALHPWQRNTLRGAALACVALTIALVATPFLRQSAMQAETEARIAALQPRMREAEALQQRLDQAAASVNALAAAQAEFGSALAVLHALTAVLPDDTFLTDLTLKQRQIALRGQSANAALLISALSAEPSLRNPSFAAPVTRPAGGGSDLFAIAAEAAP